MYGLCSRVLRAGNNLETTLEGRETKKPNLTCTKATTSPCPVGLIYKYAKLDLHQLLLPTTELSTTTTTTTTTTIPHPV